MCIHICILGCVVSELGTCQVTWLCVLCRLEAPFHYSDPWTLSPGCALEFLGLATSPTLELPALLQVVTCTLREQGKQTSRSILWSLSGNW